MAVVKPEDKTVLVVDDEEDVREFLSTVLEDAGFNVVTASDGVEALEMVTMAPPDFISLDLVMPRKSGIKFLYELRHNKDWKTIPVVIVTAHAHDELGKSDFDGIFTGKSLTGPNVYLEKPVNPDSYVHLVCEKLGIERSEQVDGSEAEEMRQWLDSMVRNADPRKLAEMIEKLERDKR